MNTKLVLRSVAFFECFHLNYSSFQLCWLLMMNPFLMTLVLQALLCNSNRQSVGLSLDLGAIIRRRHPFNSLKGSYKRVVA